MDRSASHELMRATGRSLDEIRRAAGQHPVAGRSVLVACSGGVDSVVLAHVLAHLRQPHAPRTLTLAFLDHGLRTYDTERRLVRELAHELGHAFVEHSAQPGELATTDNTMAAARAWRYQALAAAARAGGADVVATGHHAGDQVESVLHGLLSHASLAGAAGIDALGEHDGIPVVRPLLAATRAQIVRYAQLHDLEWVEDPANADADRARARLRHQIIPQLETHYPGASASLGRIGRQAKRARDTEAQLAAALLAAADAHAGRLPTALVTDIQPAAAVAVIAEWLRQQGLGRSLNRGIITAAYELARDPAPGTGRRIATARGDIVRDGDVLVLGPQRASRAHSPRTAPISSEAPTA